MGDVMVWNTKQHHADIRARGTNAVIIKMRIKRDKLRKLSEAGLSRQEACKEMSMTAKQLNTFLRQNEGNNNWPIDT
jgi:hypothetical protein